MKGEEVIGRDYGMLEKHKLVLHLVGLALESREIGDEYSVNEIAEDVQLHHRTVSKSLEHIHYAQKFIPKIDLTHDKKGRMKIRIQDLPSYIYLCTPHENIPLLKLFNKKAWFGKKVAIKSLHMDGGELAAVKRLRELVQLDENTGTIWLTSKGADVAFDILEDLVRIKNATIKNPVEGSKILSERSYPIEITLPENIERFSYGLSAIRPEHIPEVPALDRVKEQLNQVQSLIEELIKKIKDEKNARLILPSQLEGVIF